jgi:hypothetical protein
LRALFPWSRTTSYPSTATATTSENRSY